MLWQPGLGLGLGGLREGHGGGGEEGPIVLPLFVLNLHALLGFSVAVSLSAVDTTGFCLSPQG